MPVGTRPPELLSVLWLVRLANARMRAGEPEREIADACRLRLRLRCF
jgi:hypothetical protein